jgi:hypothetical protein
MHASYQLMMPRLIDADVLATEPALLLAGFEPLSVVPIPSNMSHPTRAGREWLGRWRLQRPQQEQQQSERHMHGCELRI